MKKFVLALLAVVLVLGLSAVAFADCDHSYEGDIAFVSELYDGTCTHNKVFVAKCNVCGDEFECEKPNSKNPDNHNAVPVSGHDQPVLSDCTKDWEIDVYCTWCNNKLGTETMSGNDSHTWVLEDTLTKATCTTNGKVVEVCSVKGCTGKRERTVSATGHDYAHIKTEFGKNPCTDNTYDYFECQNCGDDKVVYKYSKIYKNGKLVKIGAYGDADESHNNINNSARNHKWDNGDSAYVHEDWIIERTCVDKGVELVRCEICQHKNTVEKAALGHKFSNWVIKIEPRCTTDGMEVRHCTRENCWDPQLGNAFQEVKVIPAHGHTLGDVTSTAATCTADGSKTGMCAICEEKVTETIKATGHAYGEWTVKDGLRYKVCANCNDIVVETVAPVVPETPADPEDKPTTGGNENTGNGGSSSTGSGSDASIPATGDNTSNAPYIMMVAAVAGLVVLVASKRKVNC